MRSCACPPLPLYYFPPSSFFLHTKGCGCYGNTWLRSARQAVWQVQEVWERSFAAAEAILESFRLDTAPPLPFPFAPFRVLFASGRVLHLLPAYICAGSSSVKGDGTGNPPEMCFAVFLNPLLFSRRTVLHASLFESEKFTVFEFASCWNFAPCGVMSRENWER